MWNAIAHVRPVILLIGPTVDRISNYLGVGNSCWVQCAPSPSQIERQPRKIDNAAIATVATQVMGSTHKNTVDRAWFDTKSTKHAFRVVNGEAGDLEALGTFNPRFANVNTIDRARFGALVAGNARGQIKAVKSTVAGRHGDGQLWIFEMLGKSFSLGTIGDHPISESHPHSMCHRVHRFDDVTKPWPGPFNLLNHAVSVSFGGRLFRYQAFCDTEGVNRSKTSARDFHG